MLNLPFMPPLIIVIAFTFILPEQARPEAAIIGLLAMGIAEQVKTLGIYMQAPELIMFA